jgi:hypothetical protein
MDRFSLEESHADNRRPVSRRPASNERRPNAPADYVELVRS